MSFVEQGPLQYGQQYRVKPLPKPNRTHPVYFLSYLRSKDQTDYSGVETYVAEKLEQQNLSFVPSRTSLVIQNSKINIGNEDDIKGHIGGMIDQAVGSINKTISSLTASFTEVTARLDELESKPKAVR